MLFVHFSESRSRLARLLIFGGDEIKVAVGLADNGKYKAIDLPTFASANYEAAQGEVESDESGERLSVYDALYETALLQHIPNSVINDILRIFIYSVDFLKPVWAGDSFNVFFQNDQGRETDKLLYASLTLNDKTYTYYFFDYNRTYRFFDQAGRSAALFFLHKPVPAGRVTSPFGFRYHPILGYYRLHTGVDFGAPVGTPILTSADGLVTFAGWDAGYGRRVVVHHAEGYSSTYNHMSAFAKGIALGVNVRQGQVVGFLGSSGLATGPHLHYEILTKAKGFVDPMAIKDSQAVILKGQELTNFHRERDTIDNLMSLTPSQISQSNPNLKSGDNRTSEKR